MRWIVAAGSPFIGMTCCGPFSSEDEANAWAEAELDNVPDWWVVELEGVGG